MIKNDLQGKNEQIEEKNEVIVGGPVNSSKLGRPMKMTTRNETTVTSLTTLVGTTYNIIEKKIYING